MADDLTTQSATLATIPASSVIATDDVAGKHYQKMKLFDGTADSATAIAVAGGVEANALRVTIASDSTGVVSVDDNGASLTVDGSVTANAGTNLNTSALALEAGGNLAGAATSLALIDDIVYTDDTSTHATGTSKGALLMAAAVPTDAAVNANDIGAVAMTTDRKLHVSVQDALPAGTNNIGDVDVLTLPALVAGTANIGDVDVLTIAAGDNNIGNVDIVTMPAITGAVTVSSGSITADTELPTAAAISAENTAAPTAPSIYNFPLLFDGTNWDRAKGDSTDGALVNLGGNNDVTVTSGTVIATQATATNLKVDASGVAVPVTDNSGSLTVDAPVGTPAFVRLSDGAAAITTLPVSLASVPSHAVTIDAGAVTSLALIDDPVFADEAAFTVASSKVMASGILAVSSSAQPDSTATGTAVIPIANRNRVPFVIGGDPGVITLKHTTITTAVTDAAIVTIAGSLKIVVTRITVTLDNASTVFPTLLVGFGTANTPTTTGVLIAHGGVPAGGGMNVGDGSGIIGVGGDGEDLRVTTTGNATGNGLQITVSYYLIVA